MPTPTLLPDRGSLFFIPDSMLLRKHLAHDDPQGPVVLPHRLCPTRNPRCSPGALGGSHQGQQVCCLSPDDARCHGSAALGTPLGPVKERAGLCAAAAASACGEAILTSPSASQPHHSAWESPAEETGSVCKWGVWVCVKCLVAICTHSCSPAGRCIGGSRAGLGAESRVPVFIIIHIYIYIFHVYTVFSLGLY